jgi:drug/metabolite transporter (DMT)-like permease
VISDAAFGALCALGSAAMWAVNSLIVRTLDRALGSVAINAIRTTVGGLGLLAVLMLVRGPGAFAAVSPAGFALLAVSIILAIALGDTVFFESTRRIGLARGMTVAATYPGLAALLAAAFLDEPLTPRLGAGLLLTLGGVVLIVAGRGGPALEPRGWWIGVGAASLASVAWAVSTIFLKAPLAEMDVVTAQAIRLPIAGALLFATPWARGSLRELQGGDRSVLVRMAALSALTALSSVLFVAGVKHGGVAVATVLSSTAPLFAIPLGLLFLGERLRLLSLLGALVAVAGVAVLQL